MSKKQEAKAQDASGTQQQLNELYLAHQVHALAQRILHQIAASRQAPAWPMPMAGPAPVPPVARGWGGGASLNQPAGPIPGQPLLYWYP